MNKDSGDSRERDDFADALAKAAAATERARCDDAANLRSVIKDAVALNEKYPSAKPTPLGGPRRLRQPVSRRLALQDKSPPIGGLATILRQPAARSTVGARTKCCAWLIDQMKLSPDKRPNPKDSYLKAAKEKFCGLSGRQFSTAWAQAIEKTLAKWDSGGRPKKSPHQNPRTK